MWGPAPSTGRASVITSFSDEDLGTASRVRGATWQLGIPTPELNEGGEAEEILPGKLEAEALHS